MTNKTHSWAKSIVKVPNQKVTKPPECTSLYNSIPFIFEYFHNKQDS